MSPALENQTLFVLMSFNLLYRSPSFLFRHEIPTAIQNTLN